MTLSEVTLAEAVTEGRLGYSGPYQLTSLSKYEKVFDSTILIMFMVPMKQSRRGTLSDDRRLVVQSSANKPGVMVI
jgi:hypothetical protein